MLQQVFSISGINMQKFLLILTTILFIATAAPSIHADDRQTQIGVITALTGQFATIGSAVKNGIELARSERPELFKNIAFIYEDDQNDPKQSLSAYKKLRDSNNVQVVFGFGPALGLVLAPLAERDSLPLINFNFEPTPAIGRKFVVRPMNYARQYMEVLASYLITQGNTKLSVIYAESPFFISMVNGLREAIGKNGTVDVLATYNPSDTDFKATILKLKSKASGPVGLFLTPDQILEFLKQASELHVEREYFGTDLFETAARIVSDPKNLQGCLYPDNQVSSSFRQSYRTKFSNEAQLTFAGAAYEMTVLVGELLTTNKFAGREEILSLLTSVRDRSGVLGKYSFINDKAFGQFFEFPIYVKHIVGAVGLPVAQ
jgi:branched-chain amino acid transport system substrate-binding protein